MWTLALAISANLIGILALGISIWALVTTLSIKQSTHQVQFIPIDPEDAKSPKELEQKLQRPNVEWEEDEL